MIYGHSYPEAKSIPKEREILFEKVKVSGDNYQKTLTQKGENYHYETQKSLPKGTYIVEAYYKPTTWSQKADGKWEMAKTRKDIDGEVKFCGIYSMLGKSIVSVGEDDGAYALKPLNRYLEITPMVKAGDIKVGKLVKFKITRDGKPVKQVEITGNYAGYSSNLDMSTPFYAKSDLKGEFEFRPLHPGQWYLHSEIETETNNPECETRGEETTLSFQVKE